MLTERRQRILKAVIDDYIATSEPVGSKRLVEAYDLDVSSATVRNELAALEDLGYLTQPHTSAGRVPSDLAYREYVDNLMEPEALPKEDQALIRQTLSLHRNELMETLRSAAVVLSRQSGYVSVAVTPAVQDSMLDQVKMLMIEPGKVLVVIVLKAGLVRDRVVRMPMSLDHETLALISKVIEESFAGQSIEDITLVALEAATKNLPLPESLLNQVLYETYVSIKQADQLDSYVEGVPNLFQHPEFHEAHRAYRIMDALTTHGLIAGVISEQNEMHAPQTDGQSSQVPAVPRSKTDFMIRIGQELQVQGLEDCSFVTTTYKVGEGLHGRIAVVGPKRMRYEQVVSEIRFVRQTIHEIDQNNQNPEERTLS